MFISKTWYFDAVMFQRRKYPFTSKIDNKVGYLDSWGKRKAVRDFEKSRTGFWEKPYGILRKGIGTTVIMGATFFESGSCIINGCQFLSMRYFKNGYGQIYLFFCLPINPAAFYRKTTRGNRHFNRNWTFFERQWQKWEKWQKW